MTSLTGPIATVVDEIMIIRSSQELSDVVRNRRRELGLTQEELAGVIGVHRVFVSQFEGGKRSVRFDSALRLLQALGLDIDLRPRDE
jgi:HTH-type transcriptional regulator/antitoxin HipB